MDAERGLPDNKDGGGVCYKAVLLGLVDTLRPTNPIIKIASIKVWALFKRGQEELSTLRADSQQ